MGNYGKECQHGIRAQGICCSFPGVFPRAQAQPLPSLTALTGSYWGPGKAPAGNHSVLHSHWDSCLFRELCGEQRESPSQGAAPGARGGAGSAPEPPSPFSTPQCPCWGLRHPSGTGLLPGLQRPRPRAQDGPGVAGARAGRGRAAPGISHTDNHRRACSAAPRGLAGMCRWSPGCAELAPPLAGPGGFRELGMHDRDQPQPSVRQQAHPARARPRFTIRTPPAEARDRSGCVPEPRPTRDNPG